MKKIIAKLTALVFVLTCVFISVVQADEKIISTWFEDSYVTSGVGTKLYYKNTTTRVVTDSDTAHGKSVYSKAGRAATTTFGVSAVILDSDATGITKHNISNIAQTGSACLDIKVDSADEVANYYVALGSLYNTDSDGQNFVGVPLSKYYSASDAGTWKTVSVPFTDFADSTIDRFMWNKAEISQELDFTGICYFGLVWDGSVTGSIAYMDNMKFVNEEYDDTLKTVPNSDSIKLSWDKKSGAAAYNVYRDGTLIASVRTTQYEDFDIQYGKIYTYQVRIADSSGNRIGQTKTTKEDSAVKNPDTTGWFEYEYPDYEKIKGSAIDASYLLDKPAGKHGYVAVDGDKFRFADGSEGRFMGINLPGDSAMPQKYEAKELAGRLAQNGFNLVRFHLIENSLYEQKSTGGRKLSEDKLDRMFFLMSCLKENGIYYYVDLAGGKEITDDDTNVTDIENIWRAYKNYGYFDEKMIEAERQFARTLLATRNPYTGLKLKDDPALAMLALKNEDAILSCDGIQRSDYYYSQLKTLFNSWLKEKYPTRAELEASWAPTAAHYGKYGLQNNENHLTNTVNLAGYNEREANSADLSQNYTINRRNDTNRFLIELQKNYYIKRIEDLRQIGVKCAVTGATAWGDSGAEKGTFYANAYTDFIDNHQYWMDTNPATSLNAGVKISVRQQSMLDDRGLGIVGRSINRKVFGMPLVISEWNSTEPNAYNTEAVLMMNAFGAFQGWHPVMYAWQTHNFSEIKNTDIKAGHVYDLWLHPDMLGSMPSASAIRLRGDVTESSKAYYENIFGDSNPERAQYADQYIPVENYKYGLVGKNGMMFEDVRYSASANSDDVYNKTKQAEETGIYESITGELTTNLNDRFFVVNTDRTQAVTGFIKNKELEFKSSKINLDNNFATVYYTSLTNNSIENSDRILLTTVGRIWNSGQVLSDDGRTIVTGGTAPILIEPVTGRFSLKNSGSLKIYGLSSSGERIREIAAKKNADGYVNFEITKDNASMRYEIVSSN